jgi:hypothetical protein
MTARVIRRTSCYVLSITCPMLVAPYSHSPYSMCTSTCSVLGIIHTTSYLGTESATRYVGCEIRRGLILLRRIHGACTCTILCSGALGALHSGVVHLGKIQIDVGMDSESRLQ